MLEECQIPERQVCSDSRTTRLAPSCSSSTVKISARALSSVVYPSAVGDGKDGVLQHSGVIGQRVHDDRASVRATDSAIFPAMPAANSTRGFPCGQLRTRAKLVHVTLRGFFPDHIARKQVGAFAHGMA